MDKQKKMRHKWGEDICKICGIKRRTRTVFTKDMKLSKKVHEFFIENKWQFDSSGCMDLSNAKSEKVITNPKNR